MRLRISQTGGRQQVQRDNVDITQAFAITEVLVRLRAGEDPRVEITVDPDTLEIDLDELSTEEILDWLTVHFGDEVSIGNVDDQEDEADG